MRKYIVILVLFLFACGSAESTLTRIGGSKTVFVTEDSYSGNLGGVVGADIICQDAADFSGLSGVYLAWISSQTTSPSKRFTRSISPYVLTNNMVVADNWTDLTDGTIKTSINRTAEGFKLTTTAQAWTGTRYDGTAILERPGIEGTCNGWTDDTGYYAGTVGEALWYTDSRWTDNGGGFCDNITFHIYCFGQ